MCTRNDFSESYNRQMKIFFLRCLRICQEKGQIIYILFFYIRQDIIYVRQILISVFLYYKDKIFYNLKKKFDDFIQFKTQMNYQTVFGKQHYHHILQTSIQLSIYLGPFTVNWKVAQAVNVFVFAAG